MAPPIRRARSIASEEDMTTLPPKEAFRITIIDDEIYIAGIGDQLNAALDRYQQKCNSNRQPNKELAEIMQLANLQINIKHAKKPSRMSPDTTTKDISQSSMATKQYQGTNLTMHPTRGRQ